MSLAIYRGIGSSAAVDWSRAVATLAGAQTSVQLGHDFPGQVVAYALSDTGGPPAISVRLVLVDEYGQVLPVLDRPSDLCLDAGLSGWRLSWRLSVSEGCDEPEQFEVLRDDGAGLVAVLSLAAEGPGSDYRVDLTGQTAARRWAVSAKKGSYAGPLSLPLIVPQGQPVPPVIL